MKKEEIIKKFEELKGQLYKDNRGYYTIDDEFGIVHRWHWNTIKNIIIKED